MNGTVSPPETSIPPLAGAGDSSNSILMLFLSSLLSMAIIAVIPYLVSDKFIDITVKGLYISLIVFSALIFLTFYLVKNKREMINEGYNRLKKSKKLLLFFFFCYVVGTFIFFFGMSAIIPAFQIASPHTDAKVEQVISVAGDGAIPGNSVSIWVIDDLGESWLQGQTIPTSQGTWILYNVQIGRAGSDAGKKFTIFAQTQNKEGKVINSNSITVIRSKNTP
jgi:hypothetical protein